MTEFQLLQTTREQALELEEVVNNDVGKLKRACRQWEMEA